MNDKEPKRQTGLRLKESTIEYLYEVKEGHQLSSLTKAFEFIVSEHKAATLSQNEDIANRVIEKFEKKYGNALTRIRLGTNTADVNSQIIIELINSFAVNNVFDVGEFVSTDTMKAGVVDKANGFVKARIAHYKQLKDSKNKENTNEV